MTQDALTVLRKMESGLEFAYKHGSGYIGSSRVKKASRILMELFRWMAITRVETIGCDTEYYRISETGREILKHEFGDDAPKKRPVKFAPGVSEQLDHQKAARQMMERQEKAEEE